jgi:hypothetical protein
MWSSAYARASEFANSQPLFALEKVFLAKQYFEAIKNVLLSQPDHRLPPNCPPPPAPFDFEGAHGHHARHAGNRDGPRGPRPHGHNYQPNRHHQEGVAMPRPGRQGRFGPLANDDDDDDDDDGDGGGGDGHGHGHGGFGGNFRGGGRMAFGQQAQLHQRAPQQQAERVDILLLKARLAVVELEKLECLILSRNAPRGVDHTVPWSLAAERLFDCFQLLQLVQSEADGMYASTSEDEDQTLAEQYAAVAQEINHEANNCQQVREGLLSRMERRRMALERELERLEGDRQVVMEKVGIERWKSNPAPKLSHWQRLKLARDEMASLLQAIAIIDLCNFLPRH